MLASTNVANFLLDEKSPARTALEFPADSYSYGELNSASIAVAEFLISSGAQKGERALLVADNSLFWIASYLGILRAGLVAVPLPTGTSVDDVGFIVGSCSPSYAFLQFACYSKNRHQLAGTRIVTEAAVAPDSRLESLQSFQEILANRRVGDFNLPEVELEDLAALMFTSGSTAKPRGVMVTHGNIIANTNSIVEYLNLNQDDSIMTVLPFHYCFGTSLLHTHLRVGGRLVVDNRFMYPEVVLKRMQTSQCTGFAGVPSHYQILLRRSGIKGMSFPYLRYVQQAGGHLAPQFIRELRDALPETKIFVMYGQTEATARLSYLPPDKLDSKSGSIGVAIPGVKLSVVGDEGREVRTGEQGEIVAEGHNIALGYWNDPEESRISFRDGKLYTGDLATVDEDGFVYICDRAKDFVKIGGKRTSCRHIEEQLLGFDGLLEVAVIGISDSVSGEALKAFVVPRDRKNELFLQELRKFCTERLAFQHIPKEFVQLNTLPKNSAGKTLKSELKRG